ncbi:heavy metal-binding domain-containing protein [Flavobacterium sp. NKUCC04_CG]|uniref:heavy metal-binding domain-containing protein n=1 Tax=Flavobacterium sp. NKUCC04_CG TaxID=2842121 RepID=UPI0021077359|nr:heavy metal-binding domain-containing protein [Flavobacterium sp. NKUCC04_CG]
MKNVKNTLLGLTVAVTTLTACNKTANKDNTPEMTTEQHANHDQVYACPMHPEVTGAKGDKCSKCGMELQAVNKQAAAEIAVKISTTPAVIEAGKSTNLAIAVTDGLKPISLEEAHEMKMHLLLVSEDLSWFDHIHPQEQKDGTYTISETFPNGGNYLIFTDYKPVGLAGAVDMQKVEVTGAPVVSKMDYKPKLVAEVDGYKMTLLNGADFKTNGSQDLQFSVEKNGKKLVESDFENYLGAKAHIVMIGKEDKDFLHIHPISDKRFPIYAQTTIKKAGTYRMWAQFQINGKLHTADFTVNVGEGATATSDAHSGHQH